MSLPSMSRWLIGGGQDEGDKTALNLNLTDDRDKGSQYFPLVLKPWSFLFIEPAEDRALATTSMEVENSESFTTAISSAEVLLSWRREEAQGLYSRCCYLCTFILFSRLDFSFYCYIFLISVFSNHLIYY